MIWVGLDLHKRYITACAVDEAGAVVAEHRRLPTDAEALIAWLRELGGPVTVAMEATLYWAWLHDRLSAAGIAAVAAHPYQVKLIWQARCKTDPIDARKLADLGRTNLLPAIWAATPAVRAQRTLLRGRAYLVQMRTRVKNRIHGVMKGGPVVQLLQTGPGIGIFGAALLRAEIGTIDRFTSSHELAAYAGLIPSTQSSGGKTTHGGVGRAGSPWLKWILIEIVQSLKLAPGPIGRHYQKLLRAKGKPKATVAAARKLCCYLYWCLKEQWSYDQWLRQHEESREGRPRHALGAAAEAAAPPVTRMGHLLRTMLLDRSVRRGA